LYLSLKRGGRAGSKDDAGNPFLLVEGKKPGFSLEKRGIPKKKRRRHPHSHKRK